MTSDDAAADKCQTPLDLLIFHLFVKWVKGRQLLRTDWRSSGSEEIMAFMCFSSLLMFSSFTATLLLAAKFWKLWHYFKCIFNYFNWTLHISSNTSIQTNTFTATVLLYRHFLNKLYMRLYKPNTYMLPTYNINKRLDIFTECSHH